GAAVLTALGILAKFTMTLFPVAVAAFLLFHRRSEVRPRGILGLGAGARYGWVPLPPLEAGPDRGSVRPPVWPGGGAAPALSRWLGPAHFLVSELGVMFGLWLLAFLAAGWRFRPAREADPGVRLLWWCSVPVWFLFAGASCVKPGQANWPAPSYIAGLVLAV